MQVAIGTRAGLQAPGDPAPWPPQWMLDLERAHDLVHRAARALESEAQPVIDLRPVVQALTRALERLYAGYDERDERLAAAHACDVEVMSALELLAPANGSDAAIAGASGYLGDARRSLAAAQERLAPLLSRPPPPAPLVRASKETPALHVVPRASLLPTFRVPAPPPPPDEPDPPILAPRNLDELAQTMEMVTRRAEERREKLRELGKPKAKAKALPDPAPGQPLLTQLHAVLRHACPHADIVTTNAATAEMVKYATTAFLALKVTFANQLEAACSAMGIDYATFAQVLALDARVGASHLAVPGPDGLRGYGGPCLPKDVAALLAAAQGQLPLLRAAAVWNDELERTKP